MVLLLHQQPLGVGVRIVADADLVVADVLQRFGVGNGAFPVTAVLIDKLVEPGAVDHEELVRNLGGL